MAHLHSTSPQPGRGGLPASTHTCNRLLITYVQITFSTTTSPSSSTHSSLEHDVLDLLVGRVHDAPTDESTRPVNTDALVDVAQLVTSLPVDVLQHLPRIVVRAATAALHVHFDDVQWIENCANYGADNGPR